MSMVRVGAASLVLALLSAPAQAAMSGPLPRLKPAPFDFSIAVQAPEIVLPAPSVGVLEPKAPPLVLQPASFTGPVTATETVPVYGPIEPAPIFAPSSQPAVLLLSNEKTALHKLVLRPDVTTALNFQGAERIRTVLMGQAEAFFVDTPKSRQTVSVRPKSPTSKSNMTVVTNHDIYHFDLRSVALGSAVQPVYGVVIEDRKEAQGSKQGSLADIEALNFSYTFRGSDDLRPLRLFDDGKHTYFQFPDHIATPAIFTVGEDRTENIVNQHVRGNYLVVESLARQFTLRRGKTFICIYNKAYPKPRYGAGSPQREGAS